MDEFEKKRIELNEAELKAKCLLVLEKIEEGHFWDEDKWYDHEKGLAGTLYLLRELINTLVE